MPPPPPILPLDNVSSDQKSMAPNKSPSEASHSFPWNRPSIRLTLISFRTHVRRKTIEIVKRNFGTETSESESESEVTLNQSCLALRGCRPCLGSVQSNINHKVVLGGRHSTEKAFALPTQPSQVRLSAPLSEWTANKRQ